MTREEQIKEAALMYESAAHDACRTSYVRAVCTNCGFEWNRHYSTQINRENRTITVTRER